MKVYLVYYMGPKEDELLGVCKTAERARQVVFENSLDKRYKEYDEKRVAAGLQRRTLSQFKQNRKLVIEEKDLLE